jgi:hypothetical protein
VSDPYATDKKQATSVSELKAKIAHLRAMVLKSAIKIPGEPCVRKYAWEQESNRTTETEVLDMLCADTSTLGVAYLSCGSIGATQKLALIEQLPVYDETEQVANILKELLDDISTRLSVIDDVDAQMQKMVDDSYAKMVEWEKKLVVLGSGKISLPKFAFTKSRCFCILC